MINEMINLQEEVHKRAKKLSELHRKHCHDCERVRCKRSESTFHVSYWEKIGDFLYINDLEEHKSYIVCQNIGKEDFIWHVAKTGFKYNRILPRILPLMDELIKHMETTYKDKLDGKTVVIEGKEYVLNAKDD